MSPSSAPYSILQFRTEAPFVVTTPAGAIKSKHYEAVQAIAAAKAAKNVRHIHGRHQGVWRHMLTYKGGSRV